MDAVPYSNLISDYLINDNIIDYNHKEISKLADSLFKKSNDSIEYIKLAYEFVRDEISHSADINEDIITCSASEVLQAGHGICFAKSHLLVALLRYKFIPSGFCYQRLILDDENPILVYHGLCGVYLAKYNKWIRLDARGNKEGINAQFSINKEQLAFSIQSELGEEDNYIVYPKPDIKILEKLRVNKTRTELFKDLPTELGYEKVK